MTTIPTTILKRGAVSILFLGAALGLLSSGACAQTAETGQAIDLPVDERAIERDGFLPRSFAPIIKEAQSAVVSVHTSKVVRVVNSTGPLSPEEELLRRFFGLPAPRQAPQGEEEFEEQRIPHGVGSGVIVRADGYILTNSHVVTGGGQEMADEVLVRLNDGRELPAKVVGSDPRTDVAVLKIEAQGLTAIPIADSENIAIGDIVFAIGNPLGIGQTVTQGIVSATERAIGIYGPRGYENFIQTDASINPGNSGGALIDIEGRLVGINSAILSQSGGNIGIGFAIPSNLAVAITGQLTAYGEARRGFLGVQISDLTPDMAEAFGLDSTDGALVDKVEEGTPAAKAGIANGDVIVEVDGRPVRSANQLRIRIGQIAPGASVEISYVRGGKPGVATVEVGDQERAGALFGGQFLEGVAAQPVDDELRTRYGITRDVAGVVVTRVEATSEYSRSLREGMVIMEVNGVQVETLAEASKALQEGVNRLYVFDRGRVGYVAVRVRR